MLRGPSQKLSGGIPENLVHGALVSAKAKISKDRADIKVPANAPPVVAASPRTKLDQQSIRLLGWAQAQAAQRPDLYFWPQARTPAAASIAEKAQNKATLELFKKTFTTFLWSGFECSNPLVNRRDRWDQNEIAGLYDPATRKQQIRLLRDTLGIENARIGLPNHLEDPFAALDPILTDLRGAAEKGRVKLSLDLMHFGLPDKFHNPNNPEKSDFLNPEWPDYFANIAVETVKRYPELDAITLINEPFVTNNFSGSHWNEAVAGDRAFIERALLLGEAAVKARTNIEAHLAATGTRKVFLHNESCEFRSDDPQFNAHKRFLTSDLILGADWLLAGNFDKSETYAWLKSHYVRTPEDETRLLTTLESLRAAHLDFAEKFGKSMKADTVFGMDYYVTCESGPGITHSPTDYKHEAQKTRKGLFDLGMDYWGRYRLPLIHAETNMREDASEQWMTQQLIELAGLTQCRVPVLGATWYSVMDQAGWESGLSAPVLSSVADAVQAGRLNPIGLVRLEDYEPRTIAGMLQKLGDHLADPPEKFPAVGRPKRARTERTAPSQP
jgi:hypothetical protein